MVGCVAFVLCCMLLCGCVVLFSVGVALLGCGCGVMFSFVVLLFECVCDYVVCCGVVWCVAFAVWWGAM